MGGSFFTKSEILRNGEKHLDGSGGVCLLSWRPLWSFPWLQHHLLPGDHLLGHRSTGQKCHLTISHQNWMKKKSKKNLNVICDYNCLCQLILLAGRGAVEYMFECWSTRVWEWFQIISNDSSANFFIDRRQQLVQIKSQTWRTFSKTFFLVRKCSVLSFSWRNIQDFQKNQN